MNASESLYCHQLQYSLWFTDSSGSSEDEDMDTTPAVQVTVKFSPRNHEKSKISQDVSHQQYLMKIAEEPWCETTYHCNDSSLALVKFFEQC